MTCDRGGFHVEGSLDTRFGGGFPVLMDICMLYFFPIVSRQAAISLLPPLTLSEEVTMYLELASIHTQMDHIHEATKIIQDALNEFSGTSEEFRQVSVPDRCFNYAAKILESTYGLFCTEEEGGTSPSPF